MKNIVLFGGAFDPIHNGHINMAIEASRQLDADIFFIPARISVWKSDSAPIEDKINMINLALQDTKLNDRFHVSRFEADSKKEINYSIDTVKHFRDEFKDTKLYLLIGTDQVNSFHKWKSAEEIAEIATVIYFNRPGLKLDSENITKYKMVEIKGTLKDVSSSDIRELKSLDTPDSVINYILDSNLYFINKIKGYMNEKRFIHSLSTAKLSYEIAKANHLKDAHKALIAGLLHDIGKDMPMNKQKKIMVEHFPEFVNYPPVIYHQFIGSFLAEKDFEITDSVILDAIKYHTTANSGMTEVGIIVHCADKIEPTRNFDSKNLINKLKSSLIDGFVETLKSNVEYYERKGVDYSNELQMACLNQYLK